MLGLPYSQWWINDDWEESSWFPLDYGAPLWELNVDDRAPLQELGFASPLEIALWAIPSMGIVVDLTIGSDLWGRV